MIFDNFKLLNVNKKFKMHEARMQNENQNDMNIHTYLIIIFCWHSLHYFVVQILYLSLNSALDCYQKQRQNGCQKRYLRHRFLGCAGQKPGTHRKNGYAQRMCEAPARPFGFRVNQECSRVFTLNKCT